MSILMAGGQSDGAWTDVYSGDRLLLSMCIVISGKGRKAIGSIGPSSKAGEVRGGDRAASSGSNGDETGKDACNMQVDHSRVSKK